MEETARKPEIFAETEIGQCFFPIFWLYAKKNKKNAGKDFLVSFLISASGCSAPIPSLKVSLFIIIWSTDLVYQIKLLSY